MKLTRKTLLMPVIMALALVPMVAVWAADKAEHEIKGVVQTMPANRIGVWKIGDKEITVNAKTRFDEKECVLKLGSLAEAEYEVQGNSLIARKLECEGPEEDEGEEEGDERDND